MTSVLAGGTWKSISTGPKVAANWKNPALTQPPKLQLCPTKNCDKKQCIVELIEKFQKCFYIQTLQNLKFWFITAKCARIIATKAWTITSQSIKSFIIQQEKLKHKCHLKYIFIKKNCQNFDLWKMYLTTQTKYLILIFIVCSHNCFKFNLFIIKKTADLEKVVNCPQAEDSELYNVLKIAKFVTKVDQKCEY